MKTNINKIDIRDIDYLAIMNAAVKGHSAKPLPNVSNLVKSFMKNRNDSTQKSISVSALVNKILKSQTKKEVKMRRTKEEMLRIRGAILYILVKEGELSTAEVVEKFGLSQKQANAELNDAKTTLRQLRTMSVLI